MYTVTMISISQETAGLGDSNPPHLLIIQAQVFKIPKMPAEHCGSISPRGCSEAESHLFPSVITEF